MAYSYPMRLLDVSGATPSTVDFSPGYGWTNPGNYMREVDYSKSAKRYSYQTGHKERWNLLVDHVSKTDRDKIVSWWQDQDYLYFYPDMINDASTYYNIYFINEERPLMSRPGGWLNKFKGELILYEK